MRHVDPPSTSVPDRGRATTTVLLVAGTWAMKLDSSGNVLWSRDVLAGLGNTVIASDSRGRMIVASTFTGTLDIGGEHLESGHGNAVVLMALAP